MSKFELKRNMDTGMFEVLEIRTVPLGAFRDPKYAQFFMDALDATPEVPRTDETQAMLKQVADDVVKKVDAWDANRAQTEDIRATSTENLVPDIPNPNYDIRDATAKSENRWIADKVEFNAILVNWADNTPNKPYSPDVYGKILKLIAAAPKSGFANECRSVHRAMLMRDKLIDTMEVPSPGESINPDPIPRPVNVDDEITTCAKSYIKNMVPLTRLRTKNNKCKDELTIIANLAQPGLDPDVFKQLTARKVAVQKQMDNPPEEAPHKDITQATSDAVKFLYAVDLPSNHQTAESCGDEIKKINALLARGADKSVSYRLNGRRGAIVKQQNKLLEANAEPALISEKLTDQVMDELFEIVNPMCGTSPKVVTKTLIHRNPTWIEEEVISVFEGLVKSGEISVLDIAADDTRRVFINIPASVEPLMMDEEAVLDKITTQYQKDENHMIEIPDIGDFKKLFKNSQQRDCLKHIKTLEEKKHLGVIVAKDNMMLLRISPMD